MSISPSSFLICETVSYPLLLYTTGSVRPFFFGGKGNYSFVPVFKRLEAVDLEVVFWSLFILPLYFLTI